MALSELLVYQRYTCETFAGFQQRQGNNTIKTLQHLQ